MTGLYDGLTLTSTGLYLLGGGVGWGINLLARRSRRYYPAIAHTGTALGLLPTYLLLLRLLRAYGVAVVPADVWQLLTLCLVLLASTGSGLAALLYVAIAIRDESAERHEQRRELRAEELALLHAQLDAERATHTDEQGGPRES